MRYRLTIQPHNEGYTGISAEHFSRDMEIVQRQNYFQVWIHKNDGHALGAFFNRDFALVIFFDEEGTSCVAFQPDNSGENAAQELYLENGQLDSYPQSDCISRKDALRALLYFFECGEKPMWLAWRAD